MGLAVLRVRHQPGHLGQLGVGPYPRGPHDQPAADVGGGPGDRVARGDLDGGGLTGQQARIDRGAALDHHAVGGHLLARTDHERVLDRQVLHRYADLAARTQHRDVLRPELQQRPQRRPGAALRPGLGVAPGQQERGDPGRGLEVDVARTAPAHQGQLERVPHSDHPGSAQEQGVERPGERGKHTDGNQRVHRRGPVPEVRPGRPVEGQRAPHHHRRSQGQRQPLPPVELQHGHHGHRHHGHRERHTDAQALAQQGGLVSRAGRSGGDPGCGQGRGVAGGSHRCQQ